MKSTNYYRYVLTFILVIWTFGCSVADESKKEKDADDPVIAVIGDQKITQSFFEQEYSRIPPSSMRKFTGPEGRKEFLNLLVRNEAMYLRAMEMKLDNDSELQKQLDDMKKRLILRKFYQDEIEQKAALKDEEIKLYYDNHKSEFFEDAKRKVRQIVVATEDEAKKIKKRLESGEKFEDIVANESIDAATSKREGLIGLVTEKSNYIPYVGNSSEYLNAVFSLALNKYSDPIKTTKGYHIIQVTSIEDAREKTLEEVKPQIESILKPDKIQEMTDALVVQLKEKYGYEFFEENLMVKKDPKELFDEAQNSKDARQALSLYQTIVDQYPDSENAYKAQFMVGFVYSEQLNDKEKAKEAFQKVLDNYPKSELAESAKWMLDNMEKPPMDFEKPEGLKNIEKESKKD